jgi:hypothetical protein
LSRLPDEILLARLEDGSIRPDLERSAIEAWKQPAKQSEVSPSAQPDQPEPDPESDEEPDEELDEESEPEPEPEPGSDADANPDTPESEPEDEPEEEIEPGITVRRSIDRVTLVDPSTTFRRVTRRVTVQAETHKPNGLGDGQPVIDVEPSDPDPSGSSSFSGSSSDSRSSLSSGSGSSSDVETDSAVEASAQIRKLEARVEELERELATVKGVTELFNQLPSVDQRKFLAGVNAVVLQGLEHVRGLYLIELHNSSRQERIEEFRALLDAFHITARDIRLPRKEKGSES